MTDGQIITLTVGAIALIWGSVLFCYFKFQYPKDKEKERIRKQQREEEYRKAFETEPEYIFKQAKITAMRNHVSYRTNLAMPAMPTKIDEYFVTFLNEDGEENPRAFNNQKPWKRIIVLLSGALFNFISAIDCWSYC